MVKELSKMDEQELINLAKDYKDYYNLTLVEIRIVADMFHFVGYKDNKIFIERNGKFEND